MKKTMIFIDGSNLYKSTESEFGIGKKIDLEKFIKELMSTHPDRELIRTYFYTANLKQEDNPDKYKAQQKFLVRLNYIQDFCTRLGRLKSTGGGRFIEKGVDVKLVTDMLFFAFNNSYDIAILVSGDGDYVDAIEKVRELGKTVENVFYKKYKSYHLQVSCDRFVELTSDFLKDCFL